MPIFGGGSGGDSSDVATFPPSRIAHVYKVPGTGITMQGIGLFDGTDGAATATAADDADGPFAALATSTTDNNSVAFNATGNGYADGRRDWGSELYIKIKTATDVADIDLAVGLVASSAMTGNAQGAYLHYDTDTDGTAFWRTVTGTGAAATRTASTVAITADTVYEFRVKLLAASVEFYAKVAGVWTLINTHSTNLPTATTPLGWRVQVTTRTTAARTIKFSRLALRSDD